MIMFPENMSKFICTIYTMKIQMNDSLKEKLPQAFYADWVYGK